MDEIIDNINVQSFENNLTIEGFDENTAKEYKKVFNRFWKSYKNKDKAETDKLWLKKQLMKELPELSEEQAEKYSNKLINNIKLFDEKLKSVNDACANGKDKASWFANELQNAAKGSSINEFGNNLIQLDDIVNEGNRKLIDAITTKNGHISMCHNLDGFIAEQYHAATFNMDAKLKGSDLRAIARVPKPGEAYTKNSVDIVIKDKFGNIKAKYQSKYGADGTATGKLFKRGDYRGQQKLVPEGQSADIKSKTVDKISYDGIESKPFSKENAKKMQLNSQEKNVNPEISWNEYNTKQLAHTIGKNVAFVGLGAAGLSAGFDVAYKAFSGQEIEADEVLETAITTGADTGVKVAAAGALKVISDKGIIPIIPKGTPISIITNIAIVAVENIKIIGKAATGKISILETLEQMQRTTVSTIAGLAVSAMASAEVGAAIGTVLGPVGTVVGGIVGGTIGYVAGSKFAQKAYDVNKKIHNTAKIFVKNAWNSIKSEANKVTNRIEKGIKSISRNIEGFFEI